MWREKNKIYSSKKLWSYTWYINKYILYRQFLYSGHLNNTHVFFSRGYFCEKLTLFCKHRTPKTKDRTCDPSDRVKFHPKGTTIDSSPSTVYIHWHMIYNIIYFSHILCALLVQDAASVFVARTLPGRLRTNRQYPGDVFGSPQKSLVNIHSCGNFKYFFDILKKKTSTISI